MSSEEEIQKVLQRLAESEQLINFHTPIKITPDLKTYLNYYRFNIENVDYHFGKIEIDATKVMVQMFSPEQSIGTVILLHGYLDHVGILKNIIQHLIDHQYRVISYDLLGHGLSEGEKASVNSFSDYVLTLEKLMKKTRREISGPFYGIGHSTGGAILINYVLKLEEFHFDKVILIAPLIRSNFWLFSKVSYYLMKPFPFIKEIRRHFRENSSDEQFLDFIKNDPLQSKAIPINWLHSLIHWNKEIQTYNPTNKKTLLIQGTKDKTVEWEYNLNFIKKRFPNLHITLINNGRHQLFNEKPEIRDEVFRNIVSFLIST
ncbi:alpha/beta hydrolase [Bacillus sp. FJAT-29790]|uniref:alpha/beta hydrolase n=1 Tax=Bacillus sp. FJAT-29790 TaxID=1895002 RepID=UPI001C239CAE|nr:alpha/beta hydrolase [Bacillus sp. FJAT-29790]MBU8880872.1 alpha/beta hydrolase [Bacillus sp. FJAT-29790]